MEFENKPLITPHRLEADPMEALSSSPLWASHWALVGHEEGSAPAIVLVADPKKNTVIPDSSQPA